VDRETRDRVEGALKRAGLKEEKIQSFFSAVDEYNNAVGKENLVQKMTTIDSGFPSFDSDKLVDHWLDKGGYVGRNCRITSFSLMGDFIKVGNPVPGDTTMLFSDFDAISAKQIFSGEEKKNYDTLFSYIDVEDTHDTSVLAEEIIKSWKEKEISFDNEKMHMVSVFMTMDDGLNKVQEFIGHVGVLVEDGDKFLFIEKLAFELPYQVEEFSDLQEVNDYLMGYYDKDADGLTAKPLIFMDGEVMKQYRVLE
jgi:possible membrane associated protein